ncbi:hypothetical protein JW898_04385 [Candidatus Woesearchaeota archaeon]|nr:hypothetical protein [Candidatus Woesearchaeota archaeon]
MINKEDISQAKGNRNAAIMFLLFAVAIAMITVLILNKAQITGLHSLETFESDATVTGSSPDQSLHFETIPNFIARTGQKVRLQVQPNKKDVVFSDDTTLFEISREGMIEFTPTEEQAGKHNVWIIIKDEQGHHYYQNVVISVED